MGQWLTCTWSEDTGCRFSQAGTVSLVSPCLLLVSCLFFPRLTSPPRLPQPRSVGQGLPYCPFQPDPPNDTTMTLPAVPHGSLLPGLHVG